MDRATLADLVVRFTEAFNQNDLEGVMALMAEDAVYEEFTGVINRGKAAIRAAFVPQFRGDFGKMRFEAEDLFVDATTGGAHPLGVPAGDEARAGGLARARHPPRRARPGDAQAHLRQGQGTAADRVVLRRRPSVRFSEGAEAGQLQ